MDIAAAHKAHKKKITAIVVMLAAAAAMSVICLLAGPSGMTVREGLAALAGKGTAADIRIMRNVRLPRVIAAVTAGAGLSVSGLIMQTVLGNPMASPSTLGVSNAAVFGANLSITVFAGGSLTSARDAAAYAASISPYSAGICAFVFSALSVMIILGLCRLKDFSPEVTVLAGIAAGSAWTAATAIIQFYATDVGISAAVIWSFGDLGRATFRTDAIMLAVTAAGILLFMLIPWQYNALLSGGDAAESMGVNAKAVRFVSLLAASLITAVCVSFLGVIGFVGIICPHITKKFFGQDHRFSVPASAISGSLLLLAADTLSRSIGGGSALPVGAITSLLGAPFFITIIFSRKENGKC